MKNLLTLFIIAGALFSSCKKEEDCEKRNYGSACFKNKTTSVLTVKLDGTKEISLSEGQEECFEMVTTGVHNFSVTKAGVVGPPQNGTVDVLACSNNTTNIVP